MASPREIRLRTCRPSSRSDIALGLAAKHGQLAVGESEGLHASQLLRANAIERRIPALGLDQLEHLIEKPSIDAAQRVDFRDVESGE
jgi:hypothetical protein